MQYNFSIVQNNIWHFLSNLIFLCWPHRQLASNWRYLESASVPVATSLSLKSHCSSCRGFGLTPPTHARGGGVWLRGWGKTLALISKFYIHFLMLALLIITGTRNQDAASKKDDGCRLHNGMCSGDLNTLSLLLSQQGQCSFSRVANVQAEAQARCGLRASRAAL